MALMVNMRMARTGAMEMMSAASIAAVPSHEELTSQ